LFARRLDGSWTLLRWRVSIDLDDLVSKSTIPACQDAPLSPHNKDDAGKATRREDEMRLLRAMGQCLIAIAVMGLAAPAGAATLQEIQIGLGSASFATVAARIAGELGLFEKYGLGAKFIVMDSASSATTALIAASVAGAVSGPGELVVAQARGQKVVVVANTYAGLSGSLVLAKSVVDRLGVSPSAPVAARLKALEGLTIGVPSATGAYTVAFRSASRDVGANVRFAYMAQPAMVAALESGAIQGYVGGAPFWALPVVKGTGVLWISGPKAELPAANMPDSSSNLQIMRKYADAHPEIARALAAAFDDLGKALDSEPARVKAIVAKLYPDLDAQTLDLLFAAESPAWKTKAPNEAAMKREIAFVKLSGVPLPEADALDPAAMFLHSAAK
jgi:ABC-type nitrate/sulfonate/bicarbonate transport system substrate-binding protein